MLEIKICVKNIGVQHSLEKNETATMFFLKKPFLVRIFTHIKTKTSLKVSQNYNHNASQNAHKI